MTRIREEEEAKWSNRGFYLDLVNKIC